MSIRINSNIAALNAQRRLASSTAELSQSFTRLSSGLRINRASDDAAGLAIASDLNSKSRVYTVAARNVNDAISAVQVAEGALQELSNIAIRLSELGEQAANGVYSNTQRTAMNSEARSLVDEFNRIVRTAEFNGRELFDADNTSLTVQAGYGLEEQMRFTLGDALARAVGDGTFTEGDTLAINSRSVVLADITGDGIDDIVGVSGLNIRTAVGNGDGTFQASQLYTGLNYANQAGITTGDVNGDGLADIVQAGYSTNAVAVLLSNGNGSFRAMVSYSTVDASHSVVLSDVNADGVLDILSASGTEDNISVLLGNTGGTFRARISVGFGDITFTALHIFTAADLNGDSKLDLLVAGVNATYLHVGNGDGTFAFARTFAPTSSNNAWQVTLGDLNNDGHLDMVVGSTINAHGQVWLGDGTGNFQVSQGALGSGNAAIAGLELADLNGDNKLDLIRSQLGVAQVYLGNGNGTFSLGTSYASSNINSTAIGDFNSDGVPDFLVGRGASGVTLFNANTELTPTIDYLDLTTQSGAREALETAAEIRTRVNAELGNIGSIMSRLDVTLRNLSSLTLNLQDASSRIMDVDVATEAAQLVRANIRQQAGAAILAQANQVPALAIQLLASPRRR